MCRVTLGPNGLTVCTEELMRAYVELAKAPGVTLHTHVAEIPNEQAYCAEHYGQTAIERLADLGWVTDNAWLAHAVHLNSHEIALLVPPEPASRIVRSRTCAWRRARLRSST